MTVIGVALIGVVVMCAAGIAGSLGTIADELRRLNENLEGK